MEDFSRELKGCAGGVLMVRRQAAGDAGERERLNTRREEACCSLTAAGMVTDVLHQMVGGSASDCCVCLVSARMVLKDMHRQADAHIISFLKPTMH